jgi:hypothetical protein
MDAPVQGSSRSCTTRCWCRVWFQRQSSDKAVKSFWRRSLKVEQPTSQGYGAVSTLIRGLATLIGEGPTHERTSRYHRRRSDKPAEAFAIALRRAQAEFLEMPGLQLTEAQAVRLWSFDSALCSAVLTALVESRFLVRTRNASFSRACLDPRQVVRSGFH